MQSAGIESDIALRVREILARHGRLQRQISELADNDSLRDAGLSSHACVNVMLALESVYGEFPERLLNRRVFDSVTSIVDGVRSVSDLSSAKDG